MLTFKNVTKNFVQYGVQEEETKIGFQVSVGAGF